MEEEHVSRSLKLTRRSLLASTILLGAASAAAETATPVYRDRTSPLAERVRDLLSRMTLEEKAAQMRSLWFAKSSIFDEHGTFSAAKAQVAIPHGIGQIARPSDTTGFARSRETLFREPRETVALINAIQRFHVEQTRLGIPALFHEEAAHGLVAKDATIFPVPPALASSWDTDLVEQVFTVAARQARLRGATVVLTPVLDLARDPRFGRVEEFLGEDPYLVAQMGIAAVRGLQGRARPIAVDRVFATLKHFVHATPQGGLNLAPAEVGERTLRENFLVPFEQVIKAADPAIVMPSYNEVGGVPAHANAELLRATGRERLGFKGAYFSDYGGVTNLVSQHHMAADNDTAAVLAITAGVEAELPDGEAFTKIPALVRAGRLREIDIDAAVAHILALKFEAGLFEHPYLDPERMARATDTAADVALARRAAEKALVLLKNDGLLPLDPRATMRLAVIGPNAEEPLFGGYSTVNPGAVGVLAGIRAAAGPGITVDYAEGVRIVESGDTPEHRPEAEIRLPSKAENAARIAEAVELTKRSDVVVLALGDRPEITREAVREGAPGDRSTLELFGDQNALVEAVLATGKPVIALLINGRALAVTRLADKANALVEGWYLGQQGGPAIADLLFGKVNPGGKLPVSFPRSTGELPVFYNRHPSADLNRYVEGKRTALFPFGHGLSYTSFAMSPPRLDRARIAAGEQLTVEVDITNTGNRCGDEVAQIYIRDDVSSVPRPVIELKAFRRVTLDPGEKRTLRFELGSDALAFWDIAMRWTVEPGTFTISAGPNSVDLKSVTLTVV